MNELDRLGTSVREIEYKGIKYVFLEWFDQEKDKTGGYSILWADKEKAYQASIPEGYTDDEMLAFCQIETVSVE